MPAERLRFWTASNGDWFSQNAPPSFVPDAQTKANDWGDLPVTPKAAANKRDPGFAGASSGRSEAARDGKEPMANGGLSIVDSQPLPKQSLKVRDPDAFMARLAAKERDPGFTRTASAPDATKSEPQEPVQWESTEDHLPKQEFFDRPVGKFMWLTGWSLLPPAAGYSFFFFILPWVWRGFRSGVGRTT
jgi:hypothetical protein